MAIWIGGAPGAPTPPYRETGPYGPFDGAFICMNIGRDNYRKLNLPRPYEDSLCEGMRTAMAAGWVVIHAYDLSIGIDRPPEEWPFMEDLTHFRMMGEICGRPKADFSLLPGPRMDEFRGMFDYLRLHKGFKIEGKGQRIVGSCKIDGLPTLLPLTSV